MLDEGSEAPLVGKVVEHDLGEKRVGVQADVTRHLLCWTPLECRSMRRRRHDHGSPRAVQIEERRDLLYKNVIVVVERNRMLEAACPLRSDHGRVRSNRMFASPFTWPPYALRAASRAVNDPVNFPALR